MYSLLPIVVALYFLAVGYAFWRQTKSIHSERSHIAFLVLCFSTFVWQLTWAVLFQTSDPQLSNMLVRIGYLLILFLPTSLYQLLVEVSQATNERKYVYISYGFSLLLAVALMTTDLIVSGYYEYYWGHYPQAGLLHPAHVLQTAIVIIRGLFIISKKQQTVSEPSRSVLGYCKISVLVYFSAAADYLCNYGIEFYPPGIVFIATSLTIIAYAIRYKPNQIINSLIHRLYTTLDKRDIIYQVSETLVRMMAIRDAHLFFQNKTEFEQFNQTSHQWLKSGGSRPLMRFLSAQQDQVFLARDIVTQVGELKTLLPPSGIVLTLRSPQKLEGILVFDKRYSEIPYTHRDVRFLETVARQLSVFFDRANVHERLISEAIVREREKNDALKSLAASIAHEMRNPLAQISGNLYLIEELQKQIPYQYGAKPIVAHHIDNAKRVIKSGLQVIDLTMDAIKDRPVNTDNFQLVWARALVEEAVEDYAYEEPEHAKLVSVTGDDFALMAEPVMVKYVLYNLLQNALWQIKTLPDSKIIISLKASDTGLNQIEVQDTCSGIAAEAIPKLFDSFYTSGKQGGTGLGLAYCKRTMIALGGDISCVSEVDQYTAFTLSFPEVSSAQAANTQQLVTSAHHLPISTQTALSGRTLLVVEDDGICRSVVRAIVKQQGMHCLEAEHGQAALEILSTQHCDLILTDMRMPVMDGLELIRTLKVDPSLSEIPIIGLSSEDSAMLQTALQWGASDCLRKPISADRLLPKLQQLLPA